MRSPHRVVPCRGWLTPFCLSKFAIAPLSLTTCNVALHLKGLVVTLNIMHTVYNLRHNVTIIAITIDVIFKNLCVENVEPSLLRVPDGLRELFTSPSVRIDTRIQTCGSIVRTAFTCNTARLLSVVDEV